MIKLVKKDFDKNTLNGSLKSFKTETDDLTKGFAQQSLLLSNNMTAINGWMQQMNSYWTTLRQYEVYLKSLEDQGVVIPPDPVYCICTCREVSQMIGKDYYFTKYCWTFDETAIEPGGTQGHVTQSKIADYDAIQQAIANGAPIKLQWMERTGEYPFIYTLKHTAVDSVEVGYEWSISQFSGGKIEAEATGYPTATF